MPIRADPPARRLRLSIQGLAGRLEIQTASALATKIQGPRQTAYNVWGGDVQTIQVRAYARLARGLSPQGTLLDPGDWFRWEVDAEGVPQLVWQVRELAEARGLNRLTFGYRAEMGPGGRDNIWHGTMQAIFMDSLARVALALDTTDRPFSIGDLMVWVAPSGASTGAVSVAPAFRGGSVAV